jgi:SnoaL-like protein
MTTATARSVEERLRYLTDRVEIQDLVTRYGLGQDLHQNGDNNVLEQWHEVFAPEATVDYSATDASLEGIGYRELAEAMRGPGGSMAGSAGGRKAGGSSTAGC